MKTVRIAGASGFWGDRNDALLDQVTAGPVDIVMLDYLAEVTMAILRKKMQDRPSSGFATDFLKALDPALELIVDRGIQIVTNAGGMNPQACAEAVLGIAERKGIRGLKVGLVTGDDVFGSIDGLLERGVGLENLDTKEPFSKIQPRVLSANAYLGSDPIADALKQGAQIVVTGRCTDSALVLGPCIEKFGWKPDDWDRRAAGVIAGHVIECGGQASGGNFSGGWQDVPNLENLGYPIVEVAENGEFEVQKHESLGGRITPAVIKEQLIYEIGDPKSYLTPDVTADFTSIQLEDLGNNRVRTTGIRGRPPPEHLKVSVTYADGWTNVVSMTFVWPQAHERAERTVELVLARCKKMGIQIDDYHAALIGASGAHGPMAPARDSDAPEVLLRFAMRASDRTSAKRFSAEMAPMMLDGVPGACRGLTPGRSEPTPMVNHWPTLIPRDAVEPQVSVLVS